jgi:acyl carrier protein
VKSEFKFTDEFLLKCTLSGPVGDVGVIADVGSRPKIKLNFDIPLQSIASLLELHDCLLLHPEPIMSCTVTLNKMGVASGKEGFIDMLMRILNIDDRKSISMNSTFSQLGIDSLAGVEMHQMIEREYNLTLTTSELRSLTISQLEAKVMEHQKAPEAIGDGEAEEEVDYGDYLN